MINKNLKIRPTVAQFDGDLVESYERVTNASAEKLESLGLDPNQEHYAKVGTAPITEYVRLIAKYMSKGDTQSWKIADIGQVLEIDSIYIDAPNQDSFDLEVYDENGEKLLDLNY